MNITTISTGYVGLVTGTCLADLEQGLQEDVLLLVDHKPFNHFRPEFASMVDTRGIWSA